MSFSPALASYGLAVRLLAPFAGLWLKSRARKGKEDASRLEERFGRYAQARPTGAVIWFHAASVGESGVALSQIEAMAARAPSLSFLISTGTRTSAELVARRATPRVTHVYAPLDSACAVRRFLNHWRPDLGVFVESELWPNLILAAEARRMPLALVNARMSPKSLARWRRWRAAGARLLKAFAFVAAADARTAEALSDVRSAAVPMLGNLKLAAPAPRIDAAARATLSEQIGARPVWLAASTHEGEDEIALAAHATLRAKEPSALLIIAPRHPERGEAIAALAGGAPRRSRFEPIGNANVYVADTLGELGLFYALAPVSLVAGSLLPHLKGHNPIEPAKLNSAILTGPHVESFQDVFGALSAAGGAKLTPDADSIASAVLTLWRDEAARTRQLDAARAATAQGAGALETTVERLLQLAPPNATAKAAHASA
ncbi:MAG TPA: 3-deoxy-D-manno-octulosonic acid transferase [Vitreimonas sp.]|uniref:3-deoxy-D-manno-octulosonic acid transferase n=1 Tax=Vitreimonas sp. TaxID=3069702 RepID=UPI002D672921|nr:3-deoxy-D-manno-octulosonic acid transferase [Vitreimonas sp.]HYD87240.1 3-deoxy-D-manno-octulosonic acid transferase [Vitreimonas sp.]